MGNGNPADLPLVPPPHQDDIERCGRTVYVTNIDKKVDRLDVRSFFEQLCGEGGDGERLPYPCTHVYPDRGIEP